MGNLKNMEVMQKNRKPTPDKLGLNQLFIGLTITNKMSVRSKTG